MSTAINFQLINLLNAKEFTLLAGNPIDKNISGLISSDLLSHVMANGKEKNALITVINNISTLGVASLLDLSCIIFTHNISVDQKIIDKANSLDIPIIKSSLSTVETILYLYKNSDLDG